MDCAFINSMGLKLFSKTFGNPEDTPILLVHGYPDNHTVWDSVAAELAKEFYVITYDVRGAGKSNKPKDINEYKFHKLIADMTAVIDHYIPGKKFHLVGHDWGSIQSWEATTSEPLKDRILSYTTISGPNLDHMGYWIRSKLSSPLFKNKLAVARQGVLSWYIVFFHLPFISSWFWSLGLGKLWPHYLKLRESVKTPHHNPYQSVDGQFGVKLYQANFRDKLLRPRPRFADCPIQLIVPTLDNYVGAHLFDDLAQWTPSLTKREVKAKHWLPLTHPQLIAEWVSEFVANSENQF